MPVSSNSSRRAACSGASPGPSLHPAGTTTDRRLGRPGRGRGTAAGGPGRRTGARGRPGDGCPLRVHDPDLRATRATLSISHVRLRWSALNDKSERPPSGARSERSATGDIHEAEGPRHRRVGGHRCRCRIRRGRGGGQDAASTTQYLTGAATTGDVADDVAASGHRCHERFVRPGIRDAGPPRRCRHARRLHDLDRDRYRQPGAVGDTVNKGDVLATADTTELEERQLGDCEHRGGLPPGMRLRLAKASLSDAEDADVTAQIRQAKIWVNNARSQLADAVSTRNDLRTQITLATLIAPIDGVVTAVNVVQVLQGASSRATRSSSTPRHSRSPPMSSRATSRR